MGELLEKYATISDQKKQSAPPEEKTMETAPSSVLEPIAVSVDSYSTEKQKFRGTKRTRRVFQ